MGRATKWVHVRPGKAVGAMAVAAGVLLLGACSFLVDTGPPPPPGQLALDRTTIARGDRLVVRGTGCASDRVIAGITDNGNIIGGPQLSTIGPADQWQVVLSVPTVVDPDHQFTVFANCYADGGKVVFAFQSRPIDVI